jgi:hypothetical protein
VLCYGNAMPLSGGVVWSCLWGSLCGGCAERPWFSRERRGEELVFSAQRPFFLFGCGLRRSGGWFILIEVLTCLVAVVDCLSVWLSGW